MNWYQRTSQKGNLNGYYTKIGPVRAEVFRDFGTRAWALKIPMLNYRDMIADSNVTQSEVILDLAEEAIRKQVKNLRSSVNIINAHLKNTRNAPRQVVIWAGDD